MLVALDVETSFQPNNHFKNPQSYLDGVGFYTPESEGYIKTKYLYAEQLPEASIVCGHNLKFDIQWLIPHIGEELPFSLWDTQTVEYILSGQSMRMPSLNEVADIYGFQSKLDIVKTEYWDKGIDTKDIPIDILTEYCIYDCQLAYKITEEQMKRCIELDIEPLVDMHMEDYKILTLAEYHGLAFDWKENDKQTLLAIKERDKIMEKIIGQSSYKNINPKSPEQLSALLFGGTITETIKVPDGVYGPKAQKAGQVKFKNKEITHSLPRKYKPLKGSEKAKAGVWATDDQTLTKLGGTGLVGDIQVLRKVNKELDTYFQGLKDKITEFGWPTDRIYGKFNTSTVRTGRLSSSEPNLQNMSVGAQRVIVSRYPC